MPNWCRTNITFYSRDKRQIEKFYSIMMNYELPEEFNKINTTKNWIGNFMICSHKDFKYEDIINGKYGNTRGFIEDLSDLLYLEQKDIYYFYIYVDDAWCPHIQPFCSILQKPEYNKIKLAYMAEEPGCELYEKYDPESLFYDKDEYIIDSYIPDSKLYAEYPELNEIDSEPMTLQILLDTFKVDNYEKALNKAKLITDTMQEKYDDGFCCINKIHVLEQPY